MKTKERKKYKSEKGAIAALVIVTILMFIMILMGTYMAIVNLKKSQLESDIRIQQLYGGDVENIEQIYAEIIAKRETPISELKAGDYIKYDSGTNGEILCRVLYPTSSEYGLQIISDKSVKSVILGGNTFEEARTIYNNAIEKLNNEAEAYINSNYAEDARCVGSMPTIENGEFVDKNLEIAGPTILEFIYEGSTSIDCKRTDTNYITDQEQMKAYNLWITGQWYWLASHYVDSYTSICSFCVRSVSDAGSLNNGYLCAVDHYGNNTGSVTSARITPMYILKNRH